ncbi:hypothetical protein QEN19_004437 [Hanseniaspora menglaensis]
MNNEFNTADIENHDKFKKQLIRSLKKIHIKDNLSEEQFILSFKEVLLTILNNCNILPKISINRKKEIVKFKDSKTNFNISFIKINDIWFYNYTWTRQNVVILAPGPFLLQLYYDYLFKFDLETFTMFFEGNLEIVVDKYYDLFASKLSKAEFYSLVGNIQQNDLPCQRLYNKNSSNEAAELAASLIGNNKDITLVDKDWIYEQSEKVLSALKGYDSKSEFFKENICKCIRSNCVHSIIEQMSPKKSEIKWKLSNSGYIFRKETETTVLREQAMRLKDDIKLDVNIDFGNSIIHQSPLTEVQINSLAVGTLYLDGFKNLFGYCPRFVILALMAKVQLKEATNNDFQFVKEKYFGTDKTFITCSNTKHWFGFLVSKEEQTIYYFDSTLAFGEDRGKILQTILLAVNGGMEDYPDTSELIEKKFSNWKIKNCPVPKQLDRYQCGDNLILNILEIARNYHDVMDIWMKINSIPIYKVAKEEPNLYELREFKFAIPLKENQLVLNYRNPNKVRSAFIFNEYKKLEKKRIGRLVKDISRYSTQEVIAKIISKKQKISKMSYDMLYEITNSVLKDLKVSNVSIAEHKKNSLKKTDDQKSWISYFSVMNCFKSIPKESGGFQYYPITNSFKVKYEEVTLAEKIKNKLQFDKIIGFNKTEVYWILEKLILIFEQEKMVVNLCKEGFNSRCSTHRFSITVEYIHKKAIGLVYFKEANYVFVIDPMSIVNCIDRTKYFEKIESYKSLKFFNVSNILTIVDEKGTEVLLKNLALFLKNPDIILKLWLEEEYVTYEKLNMSKPFFNSLSSNPSYTFIFKEIWEDQYQNKRFYRNLLE